MCYHVSIPSKEKVKKSYSEVTMMKEWLSADHLSGFAFKDTPVITLENPGEIQVYSWGLIPNWVKNEKQAGELRLQTLNARSETIFEKPSFRTAIKKKRCLVLVDGFFEWRDHKSKKYPYFIYLKHQEAFALGGVYETWVSQETGEIKNTFSIITTEANPLMAGIHNTKLRMPFILSKENEKVWMDPSLDQKKIHQLLIPFDQEQMSAHTISRLITSRVENPNCPAVKEIFLYPELDA
jgi:putative SOS response-associated peptidase YedK